MATEPDFDVCIVGAGVAGALVAHRLAQSGLKVLLLDAGKRFDRRERFHYMRRSIEGRDPWSLVYQEDTYSSTGEENYRLQGKRFMAVGGSTHHWGGLAYRLHESDFRLKQLYGIGEDWPINYAELEPYYAQAEAELGVAGRSGDPFASWRSAEFPLPAFPFSYADKKVFLPCARKEGIHLHPIPHARNSVPHQGRSACQTFGLCHVCPIEAQYNADIHVRMAEKSGRVEVRSECTVLRINLSSPGRVGTVTYAAPDGTRREQGARLFVLAAHTIESVRLMLLSKSNWHPRGLANQNGWVGKCFMEHFSTGISGEVNQSLYPHRHGFNTAHSLQFYNTPERARIGAIKLTFANGSPTPAELAESSSRWGRALKEEIREKYGRWVAVVANVEQLPREENFIGLDARQNDEFGDPVPRIHLSVGDYEARTLRYARGILIRLIRSMGARIPVSMYWRHMRNERHPIAHHMGGLRMGNDPARSVVDRNQRVHGIDNLFVVGSSVFPTAGAVNPTLTIAALALRTASAIREQLAGLPGK